LIAHVHPYGQLENLLGDGKYETLVRETTESIFENVRDVVPDTIERVMRLIADRSPARGLEQLAKEEEAEIIIVGSSARSRARRVLMGSVAEALFSGAPVPVAIAPHGYAANSKESWDVIGCAFNETEEAGAALDLAAELSTRLGATLRVLGVHQPPPFAGVSSGTFTFDSIDQSLREDLGQRLEKAVSGLDKAAQASSSLFDGDPSSTLIAESENVDLLVVGSRGYGPVRSVVLGSVSRALARDAVCPVIVAPRPG
jgi:nucleotide-binding universal stress UspA family protein